jgi:hypothetical protein
MSPRVRGASSSTCTGPFWVAQPRGQARIQRSVASRVLARRGSEFEGYDDAEFGVTLHPGDGLTMKPALT